MTDLWSFGWQKLFRSKVPEKMYDRMGHIFFNIGQHDPTCTRKHAHIFTYPLVNVYILPWNITMLCSWENPLFQWSFSIAMLVHQRVRNFGMLGFLPVWAPRRFQRWWFPVLKPLSGTVIVFDWDDTLLPTTVRWVVGIGDDEIWGYYPLVN